MALRYAILGLVAQALVSALRIKAPGSDLSARLAFGSMTAVSMGLLYWAEGHLSSAVAAAVIMTEPQFVVLLAHYLVAGERITGRTLAAMACGFTGVLLLIVDRPLQGGSAGMATLGALAVTLSALVGALNRVQGKGLVARLPPLLMLRDTGWIVAGLAAIGSLLLERHRAMVFRADAIAAFVYLGLVASAGASGLYLVLLRRYRVTSLAYLQFVTALVGIGTGVLLGRERLGGSSAAGAALDDAGLVVLLRRV